MAPLSPFEQTVARTLVPDTIRALAGRGYVQLRIADCLLQNDACTYRVRPWWRPWWGRWQLAPFTASQFVTCFTVPNWYVEIAFGIDGLWYHDEQFWCFRYFPSSKVRLSLTPVPP